MKFTKEFLQNLAWKGDYDKDEVKVIETVLADTTRWSIVYDMVFLYKEKYYLTSYSVGATESQDESPYEYAGDEIECTEVVPVAKTITVYEKV